MQDSSKKVSYKFSHFWFLINAVSGANPAVPIGTEVRYSCPEGHLFLHDWKRAPMVTLKCSEEGTFTIPDWDTWWPECYNRNLVKNLCLKVFLTRMFSGPSDGSMPRHRMHK